MVSDNNPRWPDEIGSTLDAAAEGPITIDLTTTGRITGRSRRIEIWFVVVDGRVIITGTPRPRDWLANLLADPVCTVHFKDDPSAPGLEMDITCKATLISDEASRRQILEHPATVWYRNQSPLPDLVARSPMVELHPT